jgi:hypothetical protein
VVVPVIRRGATVMDDVFGDCPGSTGRRNSAGR